MPASLEAQRQPLTHDDLRKFCEELLSEIKVIVGNQPKPPTSLLRLAEVMRRSGYGRSSIYRKVAEDEFPAPVDLGGGRGVAWREDEVSQWIDNRDRVVRASRRGPRSAAAAPDARSCAGAEMRSS